MLNGFNFNDVCNTTIGRSQKNDNVSFGGFLWLHSSLTFRNIYAHAHACDVVYYVELLKLKKLIRRAPIVYETETHPPTFQSSNIETH